MLMEMPAAAFTFTRTVLTPPAEAFHLFVSSTALQEWCCHAAQVDPRPSGRVYLWWNPGFYAVGTFIEVTKDQRLGFTWQGTGDPAVTAVSVDFAAAPGGGTDVRLTHSGIGMDTAWASAAMGIRQGWETALENLQALVETGVDLRLARRPLLGVSDGEPLSAAHAAALGVPVAEGFWIKGVLDGSGAHAAGIRRDDVLMQLAGQPITTWHSLEPALAAQRVGDWVEAVCYRGPELRRAMVQLSQRQVDDLPASIQALAAATRSAYAALDREVDAVFAGVSEDEATYRQAPDAWNAKQVIAHLIAVERDTQTWITKLIEGGDLSDHFHANDWTRLSALVAAYPAIAELVAELKCSEAVTTTMVATLPPAVARRKYLLAQLGHWIPDVPRHVRDHLVEIRLVLATARAQHIGADGDT
jgi:uncharacterized protein YndB with AHSA1/START domain